MFLVDTNVVSELRRTERAHPAVVAWAARTNPDSMWLSAVTLFELELGAKRLAHRDAAQGFQILAWIDQSVLPAFRGRIIPFDATMARRCAALHVPNPRPERDAMIAATALTRDLTVVTRNVADFEPMGVRLLNPWL